MRLHCQAFWVSIGTGKIESLRLYRNAGGNASATISPARPADASINIYLI